MVRCCLNYEDSLWHSSPNSIINSLWLWTVKRVFPMANTLSDHINTTRNIYEMNMKAIYKSFTYSTYLVGLVMEDCIIQYMLPQLWLHINRVIFYTHAERHIKMHNTMCLVFMRILLFEIRTQKQQRVCVLYVDIIIYYSGTFTQPKHKCECVWQNKKQCFWGECGKTCNLSTLKYVNV